MPVEITVTSQKYFNKYNNGETFASDLTDFTNNLVGSVMETVFVDLELEVYSYAENTETTPFINEDLGGNKWKIKKSNGSFITDGFSIGDSVCRC